MAKSLIDSLHEPFRPDKLHDEYRKAVLAAIRAKAKGKEIVVADEPASEPSDDLMAALEASLGDRKPKPRKRQKKKTPARTAKTKTKKKAKA
jgi:DNA end-binding protein Ku